MKLKIMKILWDYNLISKWIMKFPILLNNNNNVNNFWIILILLYSNLKNNNLNKFKFNNNKNITIICSKISCLRIFKTIFNNNKRKRKNRKKKNNLIYNLNNPVWCRKFNLLNPKKYNNKMKLKITKISISSTICNKITKYF